MHLNARCIQGRCCTCMQRNQHSWLALSWISHEFMKKRCGSPPSLLVCATERPIDHWWVTVRLLFQARCVREQFCCNHPGFCQWIREMCKQIHCLFVHQTALVHGAPHHWKAISLQWMYQLFQGKAIFSVNCKKDSLIARKENTISFLFVPTSTSPASPTLSFTYATFLFGPNPLLTFFLAPKHGAAHDVSSFVVFEPLFL